MNEVGFSVKPNKNVKSQVRVSQRTFAVTRLTFCKVLECIHLLQQKSKLPIQRARMRVRVTLPIQDSAEVKERILAGAAVIERDESGEEAWEAVRCLD